MAIKAIISHACLGALAAAAALNQQQTNGLSLLGKLAAPQIPQFLAVTDSPGRYPWGNKNASNSHPYKDAPSTGITRHYQFVVSRAQLAPDGYQKNLILINGQFPGPLIQANWGDYIEGMNTRRHAIEEMVADTCFSGGEKRYRRSQRGHFAPLAWHVADCYTLVRWHTQRSTVSYRPECNFYVKLPSSARSDK